MTPINVTIAGDELLQSGFDVEYSRLIFNRMLGLNVSYIASGTFVEMYLSLRSGDCDVAMTAIEMDPERTMCINSCPAPPFPPPQGDYAETGFDEQSLASICCLEYSSAYMSSGFALVSKLSVAPFDVMSALFNADVCNAATVIVVMMNAVGWVFSFIERRNPHLGSVSRGAYYGLMSFLNGAEDKPQSKIGRALTVIWLFCCIISLSVITCAAHAALALLRWWLHSCAHAPPHALRRCKQAQPNRARCCAPAPHSSIISAKLTTAGLSVKRIQKLGDVSGTLCIESACVLGCPLRLFSPLC